MKLISYIYQGIVFSLLRKGEKEKTLNLLKRLRKKGLLTCKTYEKYGFLLIREGDLDEAEEVLKEGIEKFKKCRGIFRLLKEVYIRKGEIEEAIEIIKLAKENNPEVYWYDIILGDIYYYEKGDIETALSYYMKLLDRDDVPLTRDIKSPARYLFKRLSRIYYKLKNYERAVYFYRKFYSLMPSNFYEKDFFFFGDALFKLGKKKEAEEIFKDGIKRRRGNIIKKRVRELGLNLGEPDEVKERKDAERIPIKTPLITERTDLIDLIDELTKDKRRKGDIITVASSVSAISQGRVYSVETIDVKFLAKILSKFVSRNRNTPFATTAPLSNPYAMQVAVEEAGVFKILLASFVGFIGKLLRKKGWFYIVAGKNVAQIDDMPASMPPYDYYVIPGPENPDGLCEEIKKKTGCEACIVDANDLGIAWVVGKSSGVDKSWVEDVMSDNPAGNEDWQTPIIILRKKP